ncbi:MAG: FAD-dependent oxidoreductase [Gemmatimonadaceae bacterium]
MKMKRMVLVGGGHAHLAVLRRCIEEGLPDGVEAVLISPAPCHVYTGMVPGYLHGEYDVGSIGFDLPALCEAGGVKYVEASVDRVSGRDRFVDAGERIEFDTASLDVGSIPRGALDPAVAEHAAFVRPLPQLLSLGARLEMLERAPAGVVPIVTVVGAGAAGVEVALAIRARLSASGRAAIVSLRDETPGVLPGFPVALRRRARSVLDAAGVQIATGERVATVGARTIRLADGTRVESDLTVWLTGAAPPPVLSASDLPLDSAGFFLVDQYFGSTDGSPVWGAGDCITLTNAPRIARAGVYAVREGPVLAQNLWASLGSGTMRAYLPQTDFLVALDTADSKALLRWRGVVSHSRWALWVKRWIDRRFVKQYRDLMPRPRRGDARREVA